MKTFKKFIEARHWRDWPPQEPDDFEYQQFAQQEKDLEELKKEIENFNRLTGRTMSISTSGEGRDSDHFVLYINGEEITSGDIPELMQRIRQIRREG